MPNLGKHKFSVVVHLLEEGRAIDLPKQVFRPDLVNEIVLFVDGDANYAFMVEKSTPQ